MFKYRYCLFLTALFSSAILCVDAAPTLKDAEKNLTQVYDYSRFGEVYDQRQNGSENYKVNLNGVVLVYAPAESLLSTLTLLDPELLMGDYPGLTELEEILKPQKPEPEGIPVVHPERPSSSTTTSLPPVEKSLVRETENNAPQHTVKRKYRFPGFTQFFLTKRRNQ